MEILKNRGDVVTWTGTCEEAGGRVLNILEFIEVVWGCAIEDAIAVDAWCDEGVDAGFSCRERERWRRWVLFLDGEKLFLMTDLMWCEKVNLLSKVTPKQWKEGECLEQLSLRKFACNQESILVCLGGTTELIVGCWGLIFLFYRIFCPLWGLADFGEILSMVRGSN